MMLASTKIKFMSSLAELMWDWIGGVRWFMEEGVITGSTESPVAKLGSY